VRVKVAKTTVRIQVKAQKVNNLFASESFKKILAILYPVFVSFLWGGGRRISPYLIRPANFT
jgi:hypothetical protein